MATEDRSTTEDVVAQLVRAQLSSLNGKLKVNRPRSEIHNQQQEMARSDDQIRRPTGSLGDLETLV